MFGEFPRDWDMRQVRWLAIPAVVLLSNLSAWGQYKLWRDVEVEPPPPILTPKPLSEAHAKHQQALRLFLQAKCLEKEMRLPESAKTYGMALELDPDGIAIHKALIPVCFALDQDIEALQHCRAVLARDPDDFEVLLRYAAAMQDCKQTAEAADALQRALATPALSERYALRAQLGFKLAALREDLKQYDHAIAALKDVLSTLERPELLGADPEADDLTKINQEAAKTWERLGNVAVQAQNLDLAVQAYQEAAKKDPARAGRMDYHLAQVHLARHEPRQALQRLRRYLGTRPGGAEPYVLLVQLLRDVGQIGDVLSILEHASKQDPYNQALKFLLARQYAEAGQFRQAEQIYVTALDEFPSEDATEGLLRLYDQQGRWTDVVKRLDQTLSDPRQLPAAKQIMQVLNDDAELTRSVVRSAAALPKKGQDLAYQTRRVLTALARQAEELEVAEHFCRTCLPDDPQSGDAYLELCRILSTAEKHDAEVEVCREAMAKELRVPSFVFRMELVHALGMAERHNEALLEAEEAQKHAETADEKFQATYGMAVAQYRAHQEDKAIATCIQLIKETDDPRRQRQLHYAVSSMYSSRKDYPHAIEHLQKVLEIDPEDAVACNDLGYTWADQCQNLEEAEKLIRKAIELDRAGRAKQSKALEKKPANEDNAAYVDSLGWVLYRRGQLDEARQQLERASRMTDGMKDPTVWEHLGQVYADLGQGQAARMACEKALEFLATSKRTDAADRRQDVERLLQTLKP